MFKANSSIIVRAI